VPNGLDKLTNALLNVVAPHIKPLKLAQERRHVGVLKEDR